MHLNARKVLEASIQQVLARIPLNDRPLEGEVNAIFETLWPCVVIMFEIKTCEKRGSGWTAKIIDSNEYTFSDCLTYAEVMEHEVLKSIKSGDSKGFPIRDEALLPRATDIYDPLEEFPQFEPKKSRPHQDIQVFRGAPLKKLLEMLRDRCLYPVSVRAQDMPNGNSWNNFPQVLYTAKIIYCSLQGYSRTSIMAR